jgi:hypothetical protein
MNHKESKLQQNCVKWFRYQYPDLVLFAIPNGGRRGKLEASIMKGEGVLAGVADLFLMCRNESFNGLFIEMKVGKGKQSDNQIAFEKKALQNGYQYSIARDVESFIEAVESYLKNTLFYKGAVV